LQFVRLQLDKSSDIENGPELKNNIKTHTNGLKLFRQVGIKYFGNSSGA